MSPWNDRTVHVTIRPAGRDRIEIVRYDRSGKWYLEDDHTRKHLTLKEAVAFAADRPAVDWHEGMPGGRRFDAEVRKMRASVAETKERADG